LSVDRPEARVNDIANDETIRSVVLTAEGLDNFSVGMNLKQLPEGMERMGSPDALFDQRLRVISAIETMGNADIQEGMMAFLKKTKPAFNKNQRND
jgi:enoyl-CoA hydratase